jgi:hypothetical protein
MLRIDSHIEIASESGEPVEVLAVGHIADHRSATCPAAEQPECVRRFVIDRLLPAGADIVALTDPWSAAAPPVDAPETVLDALMHALGPLSVASIGTLPAADLASIEPIAADDEPAGEQLLWVVRALVDGSTAPRTFVVVDGPAGDGSRVSEITAAAVLDVPMPDPSDDPDPIGDPTSILGLSIIDVPEAIQVRDAGEDDAALAVRGWVSPVGLASCPSPLGLETLLQTSCPEPIRLTANPESAVTVTRNSVGTVTFQNTPPTGPAVDLVLDQVDTSWIPPLPDGGPAPVADVILLGHFDDDRAEYCPAEAAQACRDRFVVDRVAWADGREIPADLEVQPDGAVSRAVAVAAAVDAVNADDTILGLSFVSGPGLRQLDPAALSNQDILAGDAQWLARTLDGGRVVRYLVVDGTSAVYRIDGSTVELVAGTPGEPVEPRPSEDGGATIQRIGDRWLVTYPSTTGETRSVSIMDPTGSLPAVRLPTTDEVQWMPIESIGMRSIPLDDATTLIGWGGSLCEPELSLEVASSADGVSLTLSGERSTPCRLAFVTTHLVLAWHVPPGVIRLTDLRSTAVAPQGSTSPATGPVEVAGLPVIDIDEAQQVRSRAGDDRELAISGWYQHPPLLDCLTVERPTILSNGCVGGVDDPHLVDFEADPGVHLVVPTPIGLPEVDQDRDTVVVIGHFDDRRADDCPVERRTECQNAFVVDAIWMDGRLGAGAWELATDRAVPAPATTRDWVDRAVRKVGPGPGAQILSVGLVRGPDLTRIESGGTAAVLANETWVWHATVLFGDEIWTFLLPDGDLAAFAETGTVHGYQIFDAGLQEFWSVDGPPGVSPAPSS